MVHHEIDVFLSIRFKIGSLWYKHPYKLVVTFGRSFLIWGTGITIKNTCPTYAGIIEFNGFRVREFASVVRETQPEDTGEKSVTQYTVKVVEYPGDRSRIIMVAEESKHQLCFYKVYSKKDFTAFPAFNTVKLCDGDIRVFLEKTPEIFIAPSDPAGPVNLERHLFDTMAETYFSWKVNVSCSDKSGIDQPVDCALADHKRVAVCNAYVVGRLAFLYQRRDEIVEEPYLFLRIRDPRSGFGKEFLILCLRLVCIIEAFLESTAFITGRTGITDIRRF